MAPTFLDTPVLDEGIRYVNFFNGRLLSAEDLQHERDATRLHQTQLGRGVGAGIIDGLHVEASAEKEAARVRVSKGLAVNRQGQVLSLPQNVEIDLRTESAAVTAPTATPRDDAGLFGECKTPTPTVVVPGKAGSDIRVLLIGPSSALREQTPKVGLGDEGVAARCDFAWAVEGVQFTIHRLDLTAIGGKDGRTREAIGPIDPRDVESVSRLRDAVAHAFLGTEEVAAHYGDLFQRAKREPSMVSYGQMDALWHDVPRLACDVPLALLFWTEAGIHFVDVWAVRRPLTPRPLSPAWPVVTSERRAAEGEATFYHFQEQLAWALPGVKGGVLDMQAQRYFRYLPAAGVLPLEKMPTDSMPLLKELSRLRFFEGCTVRRPAIIAAAAVEPLLRQSLAYLPIDLMAGADRGKPRPPLVFLYLVRENQRREPERYLVFATGEMPLFGEARFDSSWSDYSNY
jgi:hypothetical protein